MTRVAVVTGAAGGIGRAVVDLFKSEGWYVAAIDIAEGADVGADRFVRADLASEDEAVGAMRDLLDLERIEALINNAATIAHTPIDAMTTAEWDRILNVNLRAAFLTTREAIPQLTRAGGAVVNVSSVHALATSTGVAAYAASKAGLVGLTRAAALDLAQRQIRVNAVVPGAIGTPMLVAGADSAPRVANIAKRTPLGRIGDAADVAQAILFLADPQRSAFITGQTLVVDGGAIAQLSTE